ncbi:MAG: hypothetical protein ACR2JB_01410 [Bryobacteraceae bacterium]
MKIGPAFGSGSGDPHRLFKGLGPVVLEEPVARFAQALFPALQQQSMDLIDDGGSSHHPALAHAMQ